MILCCPTCEEPFARVQEAAPQLLPCGHSVCWSCANAMSNIATPLCTICGKDISGGLEANLLLLELVEGNECGTNEPATKKAKSVASSSAPATRLPRCVKHPSVDASLYCDTDGVLVCVECAFSEHSQHDLSSVQDTSGNARKHLIELQDRLAAAPSQALSAIPRLEAARRRMVERYDASIARMESDAAAVKAAIDAHVAHTKAACSKELKAKLKALNAQIDALGVNAAQLSCASQLCSALLAKFDQATSSDLMSGYEVIKRISALSTPFTGPSISTLCEVVCDPDPMLAALTKGFLHIRSGVDGAYSSVLHTSEVMFKPAVPSLLNVAVADSDGLIISSVTPDDFTVYCEAVAGAPGKASVDGIHSTADGVFEIAYTVGAGVDEVVLHINVAGTNIAGSPLRVKVRVRRLC